MPRDALDNDVERLLDQNSAVSVEALVLKLAQKYDVSEQAMQYRLANLGWIMM